MRVLSGSEGFYAVVEAVDAVLPLLLLLVPPATVGSEFPTLGLLVEVDEVVSDVPERLSIMAVMMLELLCIFSMASSIW